MTILRGERVLLRTGEPADADLLWRILREPEVASRWGSFERHEVVEQFVGAETALTIVADEEVVGASSGKQRKIRCTARRVSTSSSRPRGIGAGSAATRSGR